MVLTSTTTASKPMLPNPLDDPPHPPIPDSFHTLELGGLREVLREALSPASYDLHGEAEVEEDIEAEQQTLLLHEGGKWAEGYEEMDAEENEEMDVEENEEMDEEEDAEMNEDEEMEEETDSELNKVKRMANLHSVLAEASKGVNESTDAEYRRAIKSCEKFLQEQKLIPASKIFFSAPPDQDAAAFIVAWIMNSCDTIGLDGKPKDPNTTVSSYSNAMKMRAAATYGFGRVAGLGNIPWGIDPVSGKMTGNPSISDTVSRYMMSLRKKKVRAGETATSARAMVTPLLQRLYHYNKQPHIAAIKPVQRKTKKDKKDVNKWGGGRTRLLLQAVYTISFLCLLRFDEALKIQAHDIEKLSEHAYVLRLPFRKTSQYGDVKPFVLYELPEDQAHLCPVRALTAWIAESEIVDGYIFRDISARDGISECNVPMKSDKFLELFRNNLLDIGVDPWPYGTHSFRRGGCQYFSTQRRWSLRRICEWGGWSMEFSNLTIVKYLINWNDDATQLREDFLNPHQKVTQKCSLCGRTCACGL